LSGAAAWYRLKLIHENSALSRDIMLTHPLRPSGHEELDPTPKLLTCTILVL
jgi:hypothetical protein